MNQELKEFRDQLDEIARLAREDRAFLVDQVLELRRRIQALEKTAQNRRAIGSDEAPKPPVAGAAPGAGSSVPKPPEHQ